jgi:hypothetical protein
MLPRKLTQTQIVAWFNVIIIIIIIITDYGIVSCESVKTLDMQLGVALHSGF